MLGCYCRPGTISAASILMGKRKRCGGAFHRRLEATPHANRGRLTTLIVAGKPFRDVGLPVFNPQHDRVMVCGSPSMLAETCRLLDSRGFTCRRNVAVFVGDLMSPLVMTYARSTVKGGERRPDSRLAQATGYPTT